METHHTLTVGHAISELLEDAGNCRQSINKEPSLHPLRDSLFSEQQKLRFALDWAHSFLSSEICRADCLEVADTKHVETQKTSTCKHSSSTTYNNLVSYTAGSGEIFEGRVTTEKVWQLESSGHNSEENTYLCRYKPPLQEDIHISFAFPLRRDEVTWPEKREAENTCVELQHNTSKPTSSQDNCRTSGQHMSNQRHHTGVSANISNQTFESDTVTINVIKGSCWSKASGKNSTGAESNLKAFLKNCDVIQSNGELSGDQKQQRKEFVEMKGEKKIIEYGRMEEKDGKVCQKSSSAFGVYTNGNLSHSKSEKIPEETEKTAGFNLKLPLHLTVYEQYRLCVDQLHHLKLKQSHTDPGSVCTGQPKKESKTTEEIAAPATSCFESNCFSTNHKIKTCLNKTQSKRMTAAEIKEKGASDTINENQDRVTYERNRATATEPGEAEHCDNFILKVQLAGTSAEICQKNNAHLNLNCNNHDDSMKRRTEVTTSADKVISTSMEHLRAAPDAQGSAELTADPVLLPKTNQGHQMGVGAQKKKTEEQNQRWHRANRETLSRQQIKRCSSAGATKHTKRLSAQTHTKCQTLGDISKQASPYSSHDDLRPTSPTSPADDILQLKLQHADLNNTDSTKYNPAGDAVCDWLCLPDEVWLSILFLLPHTDLCKVVQVCSRLHTVATDNTLWKNLKIENSTLTEWWLLSVGQRRPRSLCLYSCSSRSVTFCGLQMFFTLCRNTLKEISVTCCTGPGLHGDQMLSLIGQLCDHVTILDMSWSGATDTGVTALSDGCAGLRLKSVVLNGCHVTDEPLKKLIIKHKESLCRLEVFGCQFLTPSCLQTVFEICPGLQHLNIGQVPKVNAHSLTVMTSQLKCLISLNLTGLKAVTDATLDALLQNCVDLQSLTLSFCHGVTDLTLHSISKYTPCIRSLDVSGCKAVTDKGVQSLTRCRKLQQLDLSSTGARNRGARLLANYCSGNLQTVKLSFCYISLENILKLCSHCKRLKVLHLYGCAHLPTEGEIRAVNTNVKVYPPP